MENNGKIICRVLLPNIDDLYVTLVQPSITGEYKRSKVSLTPHKKHATYTTSNEEIDIIDKIFGGHAQFLRVRTYLEDDTDEVLDGLTRYRYRESD